MKHISVLTSGSDAPGMNLAFAKLDEVVSKKKPLGKFKSKNEPRFTEAMERKTAETPVQKEEYLMKKILGCAMVVMFLGAAPLLAQSFEGNEYKEGKTLYKNKCQFCHGIRGDGKGPAAEPLMGHPVDFTNSNFWQGDVEKKTEDTITKGKEMMPAFDLGSGEIKAIIRYMSHTFKIPTQSNK
jgi:cytochrome c5